MTFLLIPPYLIFAFFVMRAVLKKQDTRKRKWQMGLLTAFLLYLPFGWDVILGRAVFYTLCATQGGVHVYQTVELGTEYFDEDGVPLFYDKTVPFRKMKIMDGRYTGSKERNRYYSNIFNISRNEYRINDQKENTIVATYTIYKYFGGWFINYTSFPVTAQSCPSTEELDNDLIEFVTEVFIETGDK